MLALMEQVVAPLDSLTAALETQRKTLASRLDRVQRDHKSATDAARRAMQRYHDAAAALAAASPNDAAAASEKVRAIRVDYVAAIDAARLAHVVYYENELPALLRDAQHSQASFGVVVARTLSIYSKIGRAVPDARNELLLAIDGVVQGVEIDLDLVQFAELHRSNAKIPPPPSLIEPDSAEASAATASAPSAGAAATASAAAASIGSRFKNMASGVQRASKKALFGGSRDSGGGADDEEAVFGVDLTAYVGACANDSLGDANHKTLASRFSLPWCLVLLCDALLLSGGQQTEGCFRLSGSSSEVARVRADLNRGIYSVTNAAQLRDAVTSPHTLATLLKQYCRSLSPSLVPSDLADRIRGHAASAPIVDALELLPPANRAAVTFLARFVQQNFLGASVVQQTKMGVDNLTLILGPCIFGDHADAVGAVMHLNAEQDFVRRLLNELPANLGTTLQRAMQAARGEAETPPVPEKKAGAIGKLGAIMSNSPKK